MQEKKTSTNASNQAIQIRNIIAIHQAIDKTANNVKALWTGCHSH